MKFITILACLTCCLIVSVNARTLKKKHSSKGKLEMSKTKHKVGDFDSSCFVDENCRANNEQFRLSVEESQNLLDAIFGKISGSSVQTTSSPLTMEQVQFVLMKGCQIDELSTAIEDIMILPKAAFIATAIAKMSVNPVALAYFIAKHIAMKQYDGGFAGVASRNFVAGMGRSPIELCLNAGQCDRDNGFLKCFTFQGSTDTMILEVGNRKDHDSSTSVITCSAGTCNSANCNQEGQQPYCVDYNALTGGNECICGVRVQKSQKLCYVTRLGSWTMHNVLG